MPSVAKPLAGLGSGVMERAMRHQGDAYRVVHAQQIGTETWVILAFQKKSKAGVKTPSKIDVMSERLKRLKKRMQ
jgi:phage-related protein